MLRRISRQIQAQAADQRVRREAEFCGRVLGSVLQDFAEGVAVRAYIELGPSDREAALQAAVKLRRQVKDCQGRWSSPGDRMVEEAFFLRDELLDSLNIAPDAPADPAPRVIQLTL